MKGVLTKKSRDGVLVRLPPERPGEDNKGSTNLMTECCPMNEARTRCLSHRQRPPAAAQAAAASQRRRLDGKPPSPSGRMDITESLQGIRLLAGHIYEVQLILFSIGQIYPRSVAQQGHHAGDKLPYCGH